MTNCVDRAGIDGETQVTITVEVILDFVVPCAMEPWSINGQTKRSSGQATINVCTYILIHT